MPLWSSVCARYPGPSLTFNPGEIHNILHLDNGTVWKFKEDPGKTKYHTIYQSNGRGGVWPSHIPYHVPGRSSNNIKYYQKGDLICPHAFEDNILVLKDVNEEHDIGCELAEYSEHLPTIYRIDPKGYTITLSNGGTWTFSWWQSWASYYWVSGRCAPSDSV